MDKELVIRAGKRDKEAFSELMCQHKVSMYKVAKAILGNEEDVADAMQETLLTCWEKIGTLRRPEYFKTWMTRILINHCNAIWRNRAKIVFDSELPQEQMADTDAYTNVEWLEMMKCLNEKQRIVVELYYVENFKVREVAGILHISQSAVKGRLQAARKALETYYREMG